MVCHLHVGDDVERKQEEENQMEIILRGRTSLMVPFLLTICRFSVWMDETTVASNVTNNESMRMEVEEKKFLEYSRNSSDQFTSILPSIITLIACAVVYICKYLQLIQSLHPPPLGYNIVYLF